jgi:hypothetical protein
MFAENDSELLPSWYCAALETRVTGVAAENGLLIQPSADFDSKFQLAQPPHLKAPPQQVQADWLQV